MSELSPEDRKLVTLARSARARTGAARGAALRDGDGRTYAAADVTLEALRLDALQVCVAMAHASGSRGVEAAVVMADEPGLTDPEARVLAEVAGSGVPVHLVDSRGTLLSTTRSEDR